MEKTDFLIYFDLFLSFSISHCSVVSNALKISKRIFIFCKIWYYYIFIFRFFAFWFFVSPPTLQSWFVSGLRWSRPTIWISLQQQKILLHNTSSDMSNTFKKDRSKRISSFRYLKIFLGFDSLTNRQTKTSQLKQLF